MKTSMPGCLRIIPVLIQDERGFLIKTFHEEAFASMGIAVQMAEEFYTQSRSGVLRGLHLQLLPNEVAKLVQCVSGVVMDAVMDLKRGSPAYCRYETFELRGEMVTCF